MQEIEKYPALFSEALDKNHSIIIAADCEVWYSGRAESFLPRGDRIIIIKKDNTLLIHQPKGNAPINYMKPDSSHSLNLVNNSLFLNTRNIALKEYLDIKIHKLYSFNSHKLEDDQSLQLSGTEKDMADMIYKNPSLIEKGFKPLSMEEQTKYGFIDVFGYDKDKILTVVECKRYTADLAAVTQLRRYVEKIKSSKGIDNVRGILASPKISSNALKMLQDWGFSHITVKPPKYLEKYDKHQKTLGSF